MRWITSSYMGMIREYSRLRAIGMLYVRVVSSKDDSRV